MIRIRPMYWYLLLSSLAGGAVISLVMCQPGWWYGWFITSLVLFLSVLGLYKLTRRTGGKAIAWMVGIAFILRLGIGVALMTSLPVIGHPTDQQIAGYVFNDSFDRDIRAQKLAQSDKPILSVFTKKDATDQYGGYLALSIFVYRYLSPDFPRTQLILILSALMGAAGVVFMWLLAKRLWGDGPAKWAGWLLCLYPQGVLMGASQMREPFLIFFVAASIWAVVEWMQTDRLRPVWLLGISTAGLLLISPGILLPLYVFLFGWWLIDRKGRRISRWIYIILIVVLVLGIVVFAIGVASRGNVAANSPIGTILKWFKLAVSWDVGQSTNNSGRLEYLFASLPKAFATPFIFAYGVLQPVLPAALLDRTLWIWNLISSILAAGWYWLLPLLIYATFAWKNADTGKEKKQIAWLLIASWLWIILCSARAGGDQWDNPRYRTIFLPWMVLLAVWAWNHARMHGFYWLKIIWLVEAVFLLFFTEWYASRYYQMFGRMQLPTMMTTIAVVGAAIVLAGWAYQVRIEKQSHKMK
jgi:hypothetical protein